MFRTVPLIRNSLSHSVLLFIRYNILWKLFPEYKIGLFPDGHDVKKNCYGQQNQNVPMFKMGKF